jgi:hypothetical protein
MGTKRMLIDNGANFKRERHKTPNTKYEKYRYLTQYQISFFEPKNEKIGGKKISNVYSLKNNEIYLLPGIAEPLSISPRNKATTIKIINKDRIRYPTLLKSDMDCLKELYGNTNKDK